MVRGNGVGLASIHYSCEAVEIYVNIVQRISKHIHVQTNPQATCPPYTPLCHPHMLLTRLPWTYLVVQVILQA